MDNQNPVPNDYQIPDQIDDTISVLRWNPAASTNTLASVGWDAKLRVWQVSGEVYGGGNVNFKSNLVYNHQFQDPLLSLCWQQDTFNLFTGNGDGTITYFDLNQNRNQIVGKHEIGCKELVWVPNLNVLMSGGWDGKLHIWDMRSPNPVLSCDLGKRVYTMSMSFPLLVVGCSDRMVSYFNLNKLGQSFQPEATFESHLKYQTRRIATFPEKDGYAIGSIEGRVAIKYIDLNRQPEINQETKTMNMKDDFAFRCHRNNEEVFAINDIAFNPAYGTFCSGGGDGSWIIWDKDSRSRLKQGVIQSKAPITALDYSPNGDYLAYASGYDWSKGVAYEGTFTPKLSIHYCTDPEKKKKPKKS